MKIQRGFTLIEVMTVVAIGIILLTIALPVYRLQIEKSRLAAARLALVDDVHFLERWYADNGKYIKDTNEWAPVPVSGTDSFDIKFLGQAKDSNGGSLFTLVAVPKSAYISDKHLRIDQDGNVKTCTGRVTPLSPPTTCS